MGKKLYTEKEFDAPILFLIFNRPNLTEKVLSQIRKIQPKKLFVAADGPRDSHPEDKDKCRATRECILQKVDWDCELKTLFRDENLGCGLAVSQAITWFFDQVEMGIILEDDVLPDLSFFPYCQQLLKLYEKDTQIMMISGLNQLGRWHSEQQDYSFSYFGGVWGWATWKSSWTDYDFDISLWEDNSVKELILNSYFKGHKSSRIELYDDIKNKKIDTWDIQWGFHRLINSGLCVIPSKNLVINIGFGLESTHTNMAPDWAPRKSYTYDKLHCSSHIIRDAELDSKILQATSPRKSNSWFNVLKSKS